MNPRVRAAILRQSPLPILVTLLAVSIVFTVQPEALVHSPVSFEARGIVHHVWHYTLFGGALLGLLGAVIVDRRSMELVGLILVECALALNLIALVVNEFVGIASVDDPASGLGLALRVGVMAQIATSIWILTTEPLLDLPVTRRDA